MSDLISPTKVRQYALDVAETSGRSQFTRVSKEFLERIDARVRAVVRDEIHRHPSIGKTLK